MALSDGLRGMAALAKQAAADRRAQKERKQQGWNIADAVCPSCGSRSRVVWKQGAAPKCPSCGGDFDLDRAARKRRRA